MGIKAERSLSYNEPDSFIKICCRSEVQKDQDNWRAGGYFGKNSKINSTYRLCSLLEPAYKISYDSTFIQTLVKSNLFCFLCFGIKCFCYEMIANT